MELKSFLAYFILIMERNIILFHTFFRELYNRNCSYNNIVKVLFKLSCILFPSLFFKTTENIPTYFAIRCKWKIYIYRKTKCVMKIINLQSNIIFLSKTINMSRYILQWNNQTRIEIIIFIFSSVDIWQMISHDKNSL
jgi:hypothetical protein